MSFVLGDVECSASGIRLVLLNDVVEEGDLPHPLRLMLAGLRRPFGRPSGGVGGGKCDAKIV